ncbi:heterokaryon incompatibility protein-domain-containing protein [Fusarium flagelliforme]|uniref:heterokaryon incompatibility protein-domain-containing protein n=1 Tax=Fusarium flagelliforme TaxID=2675880 RepID=UPI001E8EBD4E|nr:heterokaryon incompatibility protein-domain-containing protein [Fusarium flagelliforme]KAH7174215.1 heterokaryon incompatibility protein-domain-containing protein [Fusarium flagelliforme]
MSLCTICQGVCEDRKWENEEVTNHWEHKDPAVMLSTYGCGEIMHESWEVFLESLSQDCPICWSMWRIIRSSPLADPKSETRDGFETYVYLALYRLERSSYFLRLDMYEQENRLCFPGPVFEIWKTSEHCFLKQERSSTIQSLHTPETVAQLVNKWAADCVNTHSTCRQRDLPRSILPTRLLDIDSSASDQWVVIKTEGSTHDYGKYVALSHRWAKDTPKLLHRGGFRAQSAYYDRELPQHYQDIISICRAMGIHYLWIDSLCIFQDSVEDFRQEAGIMADIYENAFLTLSICWDYSSASLFRETVPRTIPRPPPADHLASRDKSCKESLTIINNHAFVKYEDGFRVDVVDSLINGRGWVLQERFLSPRIVYLGNEQIYWECDAHIASEVVLLNLKDWGSRWDSQANLSMGLGHLSWRSVMIPYSACSLTRQEDKLVAISGLARSLAGRTGQTYFCGIWIEYWIQDLLWYPATLLTVDDTTQLTELSDSPEVPSWLWLGCSKRIYPGLIPRDPELLYSNLCSFKSKKAFAMALLVDTKLKPPEANKDVFTSFAGASLDIICLPIQISFNKEEMTEELPYPITGTFLCRYADIKARGGELSCLTLRLIPDISKCDKAIFEEADVMCVQSSQQYDPSLPCFLVPLVGFEGKKHQGTDRFLKPSMHGLVVQQISEGQFKRIACFWQMGGNNREVTRMVLKSVSEQELGAHGTSETDGEQAYKAAFLQYATAKTSLPMFVDSSRDTKLSWSQVPQIKDLSWRKIELV